MKNLILAFVLALAACGSQGGQQVTCDIDSHSCAYGLPDSLKNIVGMRIVNIKNVAYYYYYTCGNGESLVPKKWACRKSAPPRRR